MRYITDENKNITHVIVPLEEWNRMLEDRGKDQMINLYQPAIEWIESYIMDRSEDGNIPSFDILKEEGGKSSFYLTLPIYNLLRIILHEGLSLSMEGSGTKKFGKLSFLLSEIYSFVLKDKKETIIPIAYILRNDKFYSTLRKTKKSIDDADARILKKYGFNIYEFKKKSDRKLLDSLYNSHKSEFIFTAMELNISEFFSLILSKKRIRKEPEILRLFFFDIFEALDEILGKEATLSEIFEKHPLVDLLAKMIYPENTLSGATSRVYKSLKEARTIISSDMSTYVFLRG